MAIKRLPSTGDAPRSTGVPQSLVPGGAADSAGFPWAGRTFDHHGTEYADDDGRTPPVYLDAVRELRATVAEEPRRLDRLARAHSNAVQALSGIRVLVPLLAEAGDTGVTPEGRTVEKSQELSIVTVGAPDGRRVLPVFTSVDAMRHWNETARPIPVPAPQAAIAAADGIAELIIVDPASEDSEFGVRRTQLQALALGEEFTPAWADPDVAAACASAVGDLREVHDVELAPADASGRLREAELEVSLAVVPGLDRESLHEVIAAVQRAFAMSEIIAERVDSMRLSIRDAT